MELHGRGLAAGLLLAMLYIMALHPQSNRPVDLSCSCEVSRAAAATAEFVADRSK
jgi:hypothetical protein